VSNLCNKKHRISTTKPETEFFGNLPIVIQQGLNNLSVSHDSFSLHSFHLSQESVQRGKRTNKSGKQLSGPHKIKNKTYKHGKFLQQIKLNIFAPIRYVSKKVRKHN
jgi:hypothetical protein